MTKDLDCLKNVIKWYEDRFCVRFTPAEIYALYPKDGEYGWPQPWPIPDSAGIYAFLDSNKTIVYIGKASQIGARLNQGRRIKLNFPSTAYLSSPHSIPLSVVLD